MTEPKAPLPKRFPNLSLWVAFFALFLFQHGFAYWIFNNHLEKQSADYKYLLERMVAKDVPDIVESSILYAFDSASSNARSSFSLLSIILISGQLNFCIILLSAVSKRDSKK